MSNSKTDSVAIKHDDSKVRLELLSPIALTEIAKVLTFGAKKYASWNWSKGLLYTRILAAIFRHLMAYLSGENLDPESGLSHIAHIACNCMFLLHFEKFRPDLDDREKKAYDIVKMPSKS